MRNIWPFVLFATLAGCADDSHDPDPPGQPGGGDDDDDDGDDVPYGCKIGVELGVVVPRLASGGTLDVEIEDTSWFARERTVGSKDPAIAAVSFAQGGARVTGVAPGTTALEVYRCDRLIASFPVTVALVAEVEVRLSLGVAGPSEPLTTLTAMESGADDDILITYFDAQRAPLHGTGAARLAFTGGVRLADSITTPATCAGQPCEVVSIGIDGAGAITATAGAAQVTVGVTTTPAPARVELVLADGDLFGSPIRVLEVLGETAAGEPIAGVAATVTADPEMFTPLSVGPTTSLLLSEPTGTVTFTATAGGVTGTLTETFP
jgi:hypothetical protein